MGKTTNYQRWLSTLNPEDTQDIYSLYNSVNNFERSGRFYTSKNVTNDGYEYLVKADEEEEILYLASDEDKFSMLHYLKVTYTDANDNDINRWYELKKDIGKTD